MDFTVTTISDNGVQVPATYSGEDKYEIQASGTLTISVRDRTEPDLVTAMHWSPAFWVSVAEEPKKVTGGRAGFSS